MSRRATLAIVAAIALLGIAVLWVVLPAGTSPRSVAQAAADAPVAPVASSIEPNLESSPARDRAQVPAPAEPAPVRATAPAAKKEVARIRGSVVDTHGAPLPRCRVWAQDSAEPADWTKASLPRSEAPDRIMADTDAGGSFVLEGLLAPSYRLLAMDRSSLASAEMGPVRPGASDVQIRIDTDACYPCVAGEVVSTTGQPVENMRVVVTRNSPEGGWMCGEVRTDAAGRFRLERVSLDADSIGVLPEQAVSRPFSLLGVADLCALRLEMPASGDIRVVVETPGLEADAFAVLDAQGRRIQIAVHWRGGWMGPNESLPLDQEAIVSEDAATIVLLSKGQEVRRMPVRVVPGEKRIVRL
jgi:hypothetical protein